MPRKTYPQKLAQDLAERLTAKRGEPYEVRPTPAGFSVFAASEPVEEPTQLRPDPSDDPSMSELSEGLHPHQLGYVPLMGSSYMHASLHAIEQQIKHAMMYAIEIPGNEKSAAKKLSEFMETYKPTKKDTLFYDLMASMESKSKPPVEEKIPHHTGSKVAMQAGPYEKFKAEASNVKQYSKKGKKHL